MRLITKGRARAKHCGTETFLAFKPRDKWLRRLFVILGSATLRFISGLPTLMFTYIRVRMTYTYIYVAVRLTQFFYSVNSSVIVTSITRGCYLPTTRLADAYDSPLVGDYSAFYIVLKLKKSIGKVGSSNDTIPIYRSKREFAK